MQITPFVFQKILFEVNGKRIYWDNKNAKTPVIPCRLQNGKVEIKILKFEAELPGLIYDLQRDYKRSKINGEYLDGEWCMKFYY